MKINLIFHIFAAGRKRRLIKKGVKFIALVLGAYVCGIFSGCHKESDRTGSIRPVVREVQTKASVTTTSSLENGGNGRFTMQAILDEDAHDNTSSVIYSGRYFTETVTNSVSRPHEWNLANDWYWVNGEKLRFWCWTDDFTSGGMSSEYTSSLIGSSSRHFSFQMPDDANSSNRADIVLAYADKTWIEGNNDYVDLTFRHPLANICFQSNIESEDIEVLSITLKNIYRSGEFVFDESATPRFVWSNLSDKGNATESASVSKDNLPAVNFFVAPQDLGAESVMSVSFLNKSTSEIIAREKSVFSESVAATHDWKQGYFYKYQISLGHDFTNPIAFDISLVAWQKWGNGSDGDGGIDLDMSN